MKKLLTISAAVVAAAYTHVAKAAVEYTYENDNKTLVATVNGGDVGLSTSAENQAWFTDGLTNFVKRGANNLNVWENVKNSFDGDFRIEQGGLLFYGNALGINRASGEIMVHFGNLLINGNNRTVTIAKDVAFGFAEIGTEGRFRFGKATKASLPGRSRPATGTPRFSSTRAEVSLLPAASRTPPLTAAAIFTSAHTTAAPLRFRRSRW